MKRTVLVGCNYTAADGSDKRLEPGDVVDLEPAVEASLQANGALSPETEIAIAIGRTGKQNKTRGEREGQE